MGFSKTKYTLDSDAIMKGGQLFLCNLQESYRGNP